MTSVVTALQGAQEWASSAVVVAYDDSTAESVARGDALRFLLTASHPVDGGDG